jgi:hypothetical protein
MIVSELKEATFEVPADQVTAIKDKVDKDDIVKIVGEEQLDEMATFYKVKPEAGADAKKAIAAAQAKFREGSALYNTLDLLKTKGEVDYKELAKVTGKDIATFNNPKSREVLEKDLAAFIDVAGGGKREAGPKEPKEPGMRGRPKGSKKPDDSIAFTMGGDVKVTGKTPTKSFIKRAVKAANVSQPTASFNAKDLRALGIRDLDSMDMQIKDLSTDLEARIERAKEIAAKGSTKQYTPEEAEFMDDLRAKTELRKKLKASRESIINKRIKKQDLDIEPTELD